MAPIKLIIAAALFALGGVEARRSKLSVSQWATRDCSGHLAGKQHEVVLSECQKVDAQSLMLHVPKNRKNLDNWLYDVDTGVNVCFVAAYSGDKCNNGTLSRLVEVPKHFEQCIPFTNGVRSVRFYCVQRGALDSRLSVASFLATSYSIGSEDHAPTPNVYTLTTTITEQVWQSVTPTDEPRTNSTVETRFESSIGPQAPAETKHDFWFKHPWGGNTICYQCWLTKHNNEDKFECESSAGKNYNCTLPTPGHQLILYTTTRKRSSVTESPRTTLVPLPPPTAKALEERRERKIVRIMHPFLGVSTCAKATWKHPGKDNQKIILKGPHKCKSDDFSIDVQRQSSLAITVTAPKTTIPPTPKESAADAVKEVRATGFE